MTPLQVEEIVNAQNHLAGNINIFPEGERNDLGTQESAWRARSILRGSTAVLLAGLVSGPAPASAEDMVLRWNEIAARTAVVTSPFNEARVMAIVQLSVFEAVNAITGGI